MGFRESEQCWSGIVLLLAAGHYHACHAQGNAAEIPAEKNASSSSADSSTPIVVSGLRASRMSAQAIKREKPEIVDSIVAEELNKLPDVSVGEALQRVTGVQITRDRGESGSIAIRGLGQVETTFNGREIFTAGSGRTLDFADIPTELVAGIDVYKTSSAGQVEGGIGGLVNLRTFRPFDFKNPQRILAVRQVRGSLAGNDKPQFSTLLADRWTTSGNGEFGALLNLTYQERPWREDEKSAGTPTARTDLMPGRTIIVPAGTSETVSTGDRKRTGASLILQWRPTDELELYAEGHFAELRTRQNSYQLNVLPSSTYVPGSLKLFPGTDDLQGITWTNATMSSFGFARDTLDRTKQLAFGGNWSDGQWTVRSDLSRTVSRNDLFFSGIVLNGTAATFSQNLSGSIPATSVSGTDLADPANWQIASLAHRRRPFEGGLSAFRLDGDYRVAGSLVDSVSAGMRLARRHADNGSGLIVGDVAVSGLSAADRVGYFGTNDFGGFFPGTGSIGGYLVGNPDRFRNADALRAALGVAGSFPVAGDPLGRWYIEETTRTAYAMANLRAVELPLEGNAGVRLVQTATRVAGNQSVDSGTAPIREEDSYIDALPSFNLRYTVSPGLYARLAASKTITRPNFDQLSPSLTLVQNTITPALNQGGAGNPSLRPIRSNNLDVAIERYFSRTGSVYLTAFAKQVNGFIVTVSSPETHGGQTYQVRRPQNANPAEVKGIEVGYQQFYDFLPGWLNGLGLQANYTFVDSKTQNSTLGRSTPLQNLSRHSANLVGMYEKGRFSARVAYNWRDKYLAEVVNVVGVGALPVTTKAYGWLDASLGYRLDDKIALLLEGMNLLDTVRCSYYDTETRPRTCYRNDVQVALSIRVKL